MADRGPPRGPMTSLAVHSRSPDPANATPWPRLLTSCPRGSRRSSAVAAMSSRRVKISGKSNGRIRAQSRGWNCAGPRNRPHHPHRRLRWPRVLAKPQPVATKTLPIWPSGLKRRCANHRARHTHPPIKHARRRRPIRQRAAIRRHPRRHAIRAAASNGRHRPTPISPTKPRPPSTTRSNKKWRICWGGLQRAEAGMSEGQMTPLSVIRSAFAAPA
jgi:hypothetical protein